jgi:hypothetical protein
MGLIAAAALTSPPDWSPARTRALIEVLARRERPQAPGGDPPQQVVPAAAEFRRW